MRKSFSNRKIVGIVAALFYMTLVTNLFSAPTHKVKKTVSESKPIYTEPHISPPSVPSQPVPESPDSLLAKPKIDGFLDATYTYNTNDPKSRFTYVHSFDKRNDAIQINAIQVNIDGQREDHPFGYHVGIAYGTDPNRYQPTGSIGAGLPATVTNVPYTFDIPELFVTYKWDQSPFSVKFGRFQKLSGIEWIESTRNATITRGYLFSVALPFTLVGGLVNYQINPILNFGVGLSNQWNTSTGINSGKTILSKLDVAVSPDLNGAFSLYVGSEKSGTVSPTRITLESSWYYKVTEDNKVMAEFLYGHEKGTSVSDPASAGVPDGTNAKWFGFSLQPVHQFTERFSLGARYEWLWDADGALIVGPYFAGLNGVNVQNLTFAPAYKINEIITARAEYRYEWTSQNGFEDSVGAITKSSVNLLSVELILKF